MSSGLANFATTLVLGILITVLSTIAIVQSVQTGRADPGVITLLVAFIGLISAHTNLLTLRIRNGTKE